MAILVDLADTRCVACGAGPLEMRESGPACRSCGATYDMYEGVPCLVRYQPDEVLSLIEILSTTGEESVRPTVESYRLWGRLLREYHAAEDREAVLNSTSGGMRKYLPHRHRQYEQMLAVLDGEDLAGKKILDVGAGSGFDSALLAGLGADVTALEFSPVSAAKGAPATPEVRWLAGSAHALPFQDESFDVVACQATIHHMLHIPRCISEMLRVLRPGGMLLTISDSYRSDRQGEEVVCRRFNDDTAVLSGTNENMPQFSEIFETLNKYSDALDIRFYTARVHGMPREDGKGRENLLTPQWWGADAAPRLADSSGGISCKVRKKTALPIEASLLDQEVIRPADLLADAYDRDRAMANLATRLPAECARTDFPGAVTNTKFQLLNGWRWREEGEAGRTAYNRARWFFIADAARSRVDLRLSPVEGGADRLAVLVAGIQQAEVSIAEGVQNVSLSVGSVELGKPFAVEIRCLEKPADLQAGLFRVEAMAQVSAIAAE